MERKLDDRLSHVFWIGGSPCSGKSTVAATLAGPYGLTVYTCDEAVERHVRLAGPDRAPVMHRLNHASCDDLWMRPLEQQISEEIQFYEEEFPFILNDLLALPNDRPVIAEGAALMPRLLDGIGIPRTRAIWLVPSPAFQREHYVRRDWRHDVLDDCTDREQAWRNWMERDIGFAGQVVSEAASLGRTCLTIDGRRPLEAILLDVRRHFGLG